MKLSTTCKCVVCVPVSEARVHVKVYVEGATTDECGMRAENAIAEVLAEYSETFNNIKETAVSLEQIRCVNGDGSVSAEYGCEFVIVSNLADSLLVLNSCCSAYRDNVWLTGWEILPSTGDVTSAATEALSQAFNSAKHELETLAQRVGDGNITILSMESSGSGEDKLSSTVSLPDVSSDSRESILDQLHDIIPKTVPLTRVLSVTAECQGYNTS